MRLLRDGNVRLLEVCLSSAVLQSLQGYVQFEDLYVARTRATAGANHWQAIRLSMAPSFAGPCGFLALPARRFRGALLSGCGPHCWTRMYAWYLPLTSPAAHRSAVTVAPTRIAACRTDRNRSIGCESRSVIRRRLKQNIGTHGRGGSVVGWRTRSNCVSSIRLVPPAQSEPRFSD